MNMKRIVLVVVCILITVFAVVGCGGKQSASNETVVTEDAEITAVKNTVFQEAKWQDAQKLVADSKLSDEDKKYFQMFIRGYALNQYSGKTIGELIDMVKASRKDAEKEMQEKQKEIDKASNGTHAQLIVKDIFKTEKSSFNEGVVTANSDGNNCLIDYKVKNTSKDKTIVGYQADVIILNDFEDEVIKTTMEDTEIVVAPDSIEDRQFLISPPWGDSSLKKIRGAKLKGTVMITKVLYSDGSLEKGKEPSKADASKK